MFKTGILINDTSQNEHHIGCDNVIVNIKRLSKEIGIDITSSFTRQHVANKIPALKEAINKCDIVIVNGEGSLHDSYGKRFLIGILQLIPNGKKAVLINSLWHEMGKIPNMDKFSLISFRETKSCCKFILDHPELQSRTYITPDVIFALDIEHKNIIGYGDSVYGNKASQLSQKGNYFPLDYKRKATANFPKEIHEYKPSDVQDYIRWLKTLDLYVTGRFHGVCLSAIAGTPFLAFPSNAQKIEAIISNMVGTDELLIKKLEDVDNKKEIAQKLSFKIHQYAINAKEQIHNLFKNIGDLI